ncbi:MAG: hypothetical protein ACE5I7_05675 [Candidatus Binatia bacterium]
MAAKSAQDSPNLWQWVYDRGEETIGQALGDLLGRRGVSDGLTRMAKRAAHTKGRMDKNVELLLHLLNLPSRADYHKLLVKMEHLQGSLVNLNIKLDRLLAAQARSRKRAPKADPAKGQQDQ